MIVPSIDLMSGNAVQLVGGRELKIDAGDPLPIAQRFALAGEVAVIDLDAAMGKGNNATTIRKLLNIAPCRVGGGIRTVDAALDWLDAGARKVILGTAAEPDVLRQLPRERVIVALDADRGEIMTHGWRKPTGQRIAQRIAELRDLVGGFLITFIEREGRMAGTAPLEQIRELADLAGAAHLTVAGGVTTPGEIAGLDRLGVDAQVGMALYSGQLELSEAIAAPLISDRNDQLWPTVVVDEHGVALGLTWSDQESLRNAVRTHRGVYHSRTRGLWVKGEKSGATQDLLRIDVDCDRDCLRFVVRQNGVGFCHRNTRTCWGHAGGIPELARTLLSRSQHPIEGSYTARLIADPTLLAAKLIEEAIELADADVSTRDHVIAEVADVIYFALAAAARGGATLVDVETELDRRACAVRRRAGDAKNGDGV